MILRGTSSDIVYMDNTMTRSKIVLQKTPYTDTIKIHTDNEVLEVTHHFNAFESATYLFHEGDTVLFDYKENIPSVTILNRETAVP